MKRLLASFLAGALGACGSPQPSAQITQGTLRDLPTQVERLLGADPEGGGILIVARADSDDDFIQFSVSDSEVELDHPLVTERQRSREVEVQRALDEAGCSPRINTGSDGARFLDCYLPRSSDEVVWVATRVLREALDIGDSTTLVFTSYGL